MRYFCLLLLGCMSLVWAASNINDSGSPAGPVIQHSSQELMQMFHQLEEKLTEEQQSTSPAVVRVQLQHEALSVFNRKHYREQKELVDQASRLSALGYVRLQANATEMNSLRLTPKDIPAFVEVNFFGG